MYLGFEGEISSKDEGEVYNYSILSFEIITGKRPTAESHLEKSGCRQQFLIMCQIYWKTVKNCGVCQ